MSKTSPLSRKAVLVAVNISGWSARKLDRRVTDETNERYNATENAGRFNKLLIAGEHIKEMTTLVTKARDLHHRMTLPWADKGPRILANTMFAKFSDEFRVLKREFNDAADRFEVVYPALIKARKRALNGMFNEANYPAPETIRSKFKLELMVMPFPDTDDWRADLDEETLSDIKAQLQTTTTNVIDNAMRDTVAQIVDRVGKMAEKLAAYKPSGGKDDPAEGVFRNSLVENVRELAEVLPGFNLTEDPKLAAVIDRIKDELCVEDAEDLRTNDGARVSVAKSAQEIVEAVSGLFA